MNELLANVLDALRDLDRWNGYTKVWRRLRAGFPLKGIVQDSNPRRMTAWLHEERSLVALRRGRSAHDIYTRSNRYREARSYAGCGAPRDSFAGHQMNTPWDPLEWAYLKGEAMGMYLTTPFLLSKDVSKIRLWQEGSENWCVLRAYFPGSMEMYRLVQELFFDERIELRRHDSFVI